MNHAGQTAFCRRTFALNILERAGLHLVDRSCVEGVDGMSIPAAVAICEALVIINRCMAIVATEKLA